MWIKKSIHSSSWGVIPLLLEHCSPWGSRMSAVPIKKFPRGMTQMAPASLLSTARPSQILQKSPGPCLGPLDSWLAPCSWLAAVGSDSWGYFGKVVGWRCHRSKGSLCPQEQGDSGAFHPPTSTGVGKCCQTV